MLIGGPLLAFQAFPVQILFSQTSVSAYHPLALQKGSKGLEARKPVKGCYRLGSVNGAAANLCTLILLVDTLGESTGAEERTLCRNLLRSSATEP